MVWRHRKCLNIFKQMSSSHHNKNYLTVCWKDHESDRVTCSSLSAGFIKKNNYIIAVATRHTRGNTNDLCHDDVIKWKHFPRYWPFVRGIHRSPVNSAHKGQWRGALMFPFICVWINGWVNNREAGDLRRTQAHYDVIVMVYLWQWSRCGGEIGNPRLFLNLKFRIRN